MKPIQEAREGDTVERLLGGVVPMLLKVSAVEGDIIRCGSWTFSRRNGAEIDPDLGWNENQTGSYLTGVVESH